MSAILFFRCIEQCLLLFFLSSSHPISFFQKWRPCNAIRKSNVLFIFWVKGKPRRIFDLFWPIRFKNKIVSQSKDFLNVNPIRSNQNQNNLLIPPLLITLSYKVCVSAFGTSSNSKGMSTQTNLVGYFQASNKRKHQSSITSFLTVDKKEVDDDVVYLRSE